MIRNAFIYFLVRAGNGVVAVLILACFTRLLSAEQYGVYALVVATASILSGTFFGWICVAANRFYPAYRDNPEVMHVAALRGFILSFAAAGALFIAMLGSRSLFMLEWLVVVAVFVIMVAQGWYDLTLQVVNAQGMPIRYGMLAWTRGAVSLVAGIVMILITDSAYGALAGFFLGTVVAGAVFSSFSIGKRKGTGAHRKLVGRLFEYGLPLTVTFLSMLIVGASDRLVIGWFEGPAAAAPYAAAYDLVQQAVGASMSIFFLAAFPQIVAELDKGNEEEALAQTKTLGGLLVSVGIAAVVGLAMLSGEIAFLIFGAKFRGEAASVMPWIALGIALGCFKSIYLDLAFQFRHATRIQGYVAVLTATVNVLLNVLLVPLYGIRGAAWATLASFVIGGAMSRAWGRRYYNLPMVSGKDFGKIICSCLLMIAFLLAVSGIRSQLFLPFKILLAALVYGACMWVLNFEGVRSHPTRRYVPWRS